ncbi:MAG TPA: hypothetical protein VLT16_09165, partial [Candidatus Limnocylindrales bacterium]|nr:hypothetical protein [Candidatus Limnocylindrales bacterium]
VSWAFGQGAKVHPDLDAQDGDHDEAIQRADWFLTGRQVGGKNASALLLRANQQRQALRALNSNRTRAAAQSGRQKFNPSGTALSAWQNTGPFNLASDPSNFQSYGAVSGRATTVVMDQNDPSGNTVYAGGAYGGLWKSTNATAAPGSVTWVPLLDGQPTMAVGAVALKPDTSGSGTVILAGTGETNGSGDSYYGLGILRSTDGGASWVLISTAAGPSGPLSFTGLGFSKIAFSTAAGQTNQVVAGAGLTNSFLSGAGGGLFTRGLYYSTDAGLTWALSFVSDDGVNPVSPTSATDVIYSAAAGKFFALLRYHGMYSSSDGGQTWQRLASQPGGGILSLLNCPSGASMSCPLYRGSIAVRPGTGELYVAFIDDMQALRGVYRSTDGGASWSGDLGENGYTSCGDSLGCGVDQAAYNFYLAAVPQGAGTELYLGGVNVYRCALPSNSTASCAWLNLTHSYGCAETGVVAASSHVHPDQHAMAFLAANPRIMYFANDGGIYRSMNGVASDGSCSASNANSWQNLNAALGPMTEFVWASHDFNNPAVLLGGAQDNGSPGTGGGAWSNVNAGDGGFNAIDPSSNGFWYTANTGVSIQRCTGGANCRAQDFVMVIDNCTGPSCHNNIGGDNSAFYTPYMLDPRDPARVLVGTCRVWRGQADGSGWPGVNNANALSANLDNGSNTACADNHMISALAAGGPAAPSGASSVVYAGRTDGRIFVSVAAESGPATFADRSATLISGGYKISGIAVDQNDPSGRTAVAVVMGFGVGHVWRTIDAGATWNNISGTGPAALPDAPADSVLIDPVNSAHVFVGTDVGAFETTDGGASWSEVAGGLPSVPVNRLMVLDAPGIRKLRAATYGRGMWELALPPAAFFRLELAPGASPTATLGSGQQASYNLVLTANNGFTGTVNLACAGVQGGPACGISPAVINFNGGAGTIP